MDTLYLSIPEQAQPKAIGGNRFVKEILRLGKYKHPKRGFELDVTPDYLSTLCDNFGKMKANGRDVEAVKDHSTKAEDVLGYVTDMFIEDGALFGIHDFRTAEGVDLAKAVHNTSVGIDPEYVDGNGNKYGPAIVHNAIVQQPVMGGQTPFIPLSLVIPDNGNHVSENVSVNKDNPSKDEKSMDTAKICLSLGIAEDADESAVLSAIKAIRAKAEAEPEPKEQEAKPPVLPFSMASEEVAEAREEVAEVRIQSLVTAGQLSPAAADKVRKAIAGNKVLAFSSYGEGENKTTLISDILKALEDRVPPKTGESTKLQTMSIPGQDGDSAAKAKADLEARAKTSMAAAGSRSK